MLADPGGIQRYEYPKNTLSGTVTNIVTSHKPLLRCLIGQMASVNTPLIPEKLEMPGHFDSSRFTIN